MWFTFCFIWNWLISPQENPLFTQWSSKFELMEKTHILHPLVPIEDYEGFKFYGAYGVYFPKDFQIKAHRDYHCRICDGDFITVMVPKHIHPNMAQICLEGGCQDFSKGSVVIDVC